MYTTSPLKDETKKKSAKKSDKHAQSMNFFKLPP